MNEETEVQPTEYIFGAIKIGLGLLGRRALLALSLLGAFALYAYAILHPGINTITAASLFTLLTFVPILIVSRKA